MGSSTIGSKAEQMRRMRNLLTASKKKTEKFLRLVCEDLKLLSIVTTYAAAETSSHQVLYSEQGKYSKYLMLLCGQNFSRYTLLPFYYHLKASFLPKGARPI